eukprot:2781933-Pyramimonas_sp.AAC.1
MRPDVRLLKQRRGTPQGHRRSDMMTAVAVGATWPRSRRVVMKPGCVPDVCPRCDKAVETPFHRVRGC